MGCTKTLSIVSISSHDYKNRHTWVHQLTQVEFSSAELIALQSVYEDFALGLSSVLAVVSILLSHTLVVY